MSFFGSVCGICKKTNIQITRAKKLVIAFGMKYAKIGANVFSPSHGRFCLSRAERRVLFAGGVHVGSGYAGAVSNLLMV